MSANPDFAPDSSLHWSEMAVDSASDERHLELSTEQKTKNWD